MQTVKSKQDYIKRLKIIEGQARGLQKMVETNRSGTELMMQLLSVKAALHSLRVKYFETYLREKLIFMIDLNKQDQAEEYMEELAAVLLRCLE
jgi:CsoR family transcriptional regulator, copper-sensing transcriptional repressor